MLAIERAGRVMVATLSRPPVNALDGKLIARLDAALEEATADPEITVLHIRSGGKTFCAGADLALMRSCLDTPEGRDAMVEVVRRMQRLFMRLESAGVVTLAEIGGAAMGGGLELALACNLRVAAVEARLGLPEVRLGLIPGAGGTQRLTRLCGHAVASRLILGAEVIDGTEACRLGLVHWVAPRSELAERAAEIARRIAALPPAALAAAKVCIAAAAEPGRSGYRDELESTRRLFDNTQTRERVAAFLDD